MIWLLLFCIALYFYYRSSKSESSLNAKNTPNNQVQPDMQMYNRQWAEFILSYQNVAKSKAEKALLRRMLKDLSDQGKTGGLLLLDDDGTPVVPAMQAAYASQRVVMPTATAAAQSYTYTPPTKTSAQIQLDNASLLLYFGAFLLVASVGLFVAFGGLPGELRTFIVALVSVGMYGSGLWLFDNKPKLKQAGLAFVGIGIAIMPLVGLAAYIFVFNLANAPLAWLITSVLCLGMYTHALIKLRSTFLDYLFIFTIVSLFESAVSISHAPVYYFGWMLALIGLIATLVGRYGHMWNDLQEPSNVSSSLFVPASIFISLVLVTHDGLGQLGVSLLLAGAYYALCIGTSTGGTQQGNAVTAQASLLAGICAVVYATSKNIQTTFMVLLVCNALQTMLIVWWDKNNTTLRYNFATIAMLSYIAATILAIGRPSMVAASVIIIVIGSLTVWWHQHRADAYVVAVTAWMSLPAVFVLYVTKPHLSAVILAQITAGSLLIQFLALLAAKKRFQTDHTLVDQYMYLASTAVVLVLGFTTTPWMSYWLTVIVAVTYLILAQLQKSKDWNAVAGFVVLVPLLWFDRSQGVLLLTCLTALLTNIYLALRYRHEVHRWLSTALWLLLPVALGGGLLGGRWNVTTYAWAYMLAMLGLLLSRAIARGIVFLSAKVPLASFAKNTSTSYQAGYCFAGVTAVCLSLVGNNSQIHTSLLLVLLTGLTVFISQVLEKNDQILALVPLLLQGFMLSVWRPVGHQQVALYLFMTSLLALASYMVITTEQKGRKIMRSVQYGALMAVLIAPASLLVLGYSVWSMPLGLLLAALLFLYDMRTSDQVTKEALCTVAVVAIMWMLYLGGVREEQVYTHVLVVLFAAFAYWRHSKNQPDQSNSYLYAMLATATIPLALQALSGVAGGLYGWWLLLEEVFFMIIGMAINKKFVVQWGLYVSVAAVLYQLRGLGWAALTFLAIFLIGLAVYKIQKNNQ
jgi:hypothetical protein